MDAVAGPGLPVEIGRIDKELGRLWESSDDTKTRASLINLAIYSEDAASVPANTSIIAEIAGEHACRAILILANPSAPASDAKAWINAHCHLVGKGSRQICSEQITFQLDGEAALSLPNIVFSHLDSDLPLCFWWQGEFREPLDDKLWMWVDRLIYDSAEWREPGEQFARAARISRLADCSLVLCDLNWARLYNCRFALASLVDHPAALSRLDQIASVEVTCAPGAVTTAWLLLGWLAARLGWTLTRDSSGFAFSGGDGRRISCAISEAPGPRLAGIRLTTPDATIELQRCESSDFFHGVVSAPGYPEAVSTLRAGRDGLTHVLLAELSRGGRHPLYEQALRVISPVFSI